MKEYISFDSHKHYTLCEQEDRQTQRARQIRINHAPGAIRSYLERHAEVGTPVAVEAIGNWYWIIDEIEQAGMKPMLVHPRKAKLLMGNFNKTDKLDVHGLNRLQRSGVLPTVWVPPGDLRDLRELTRTRMVLVAQRTRLKNRITSALAKYGLQMQGISDPYGKKGRLQLEACLAKLPPQTKRTNKLLLDQLDVIDGQVQVTEQDIRELVRQTPEMILLKTLPGIGDILAATIALEIGDISRFASAERLASYAGTTPRVHSSGGKTSYGRLRPDINHYLRWAFVEAGNSVAVNHKRLPDRHVSQLYRKIRLRRGHAKAVGAVARHLAEAAYHVWTKREPYRDPAVNQGRVREA
ncbi:MAG TPA: IS110 family transposase [bacterium]|nr:IS110 family transposase [bacterium]